MKVNQMKEVMELARIVIKGIINDPENFVPVVPDHWTEEMVIKFDNIVEHELFRC